MAYHRISAFLGEDRACAAQVYEIHCTFDLSARGPTLCRHSETRKRVVIGRVQERLATPGCSNATEIQICVKIARNQSRSVPTLPADQLYIELS